MLARRGRRVWRIGELFGKANARGSAALCQLSCDTPTLTITNLTPRPRARSENTLLPSRRLRETRDAIGRLLPNRRPRI